MEQRSPEWLKARIGRVTASSVGAILGNSPFRTRGDVMRQMVRSYHGAESEFTGNIATEYGTNNEAGALVEFEMLTGMDVAQVGFVTREDWAGCSPDGLIEEDAGLEIKCPFGLRKEESPVFKSLHDQPHYYDQVQFSLWVTGREIWHFFQWAPNGHAMEKTVPDPEWQDARLPILRQFHAEYLDAVKSPDEHLAPKRREVDTIESHRVIREYDELGEAIELATARRRELLDEMVRQAGGQDAIYAGRKLTNVTRAGSVSYAKALKKYAPDADLEPFRGKPTRYWRVG